MTLISSHSSTNPTQILINSPGGVGEDGQPTSLKLKRSSTFLSHFPFLTRTPSSSPISSPRPQHLTTSSSFGRPAQSHPTARPTSPTSTISIIPSDSVSGPSTSHRSFEPSSRLSIRTKSQTRSHTDISDRAYQSGPQSIHHSKRDQPSSTWNSEFAHFPASKATLEGLIKTRGSLLRHKPSNQTGFRLIRSSKVWKPIFCCITAIYPHNHPHVNNTTTLYNLHVFNNPSPTPNELESARLRIEAKSIVCVLENNLAGESLILKITGKESIIANDSSVQVGKPIENETSWMFAMKDVGQLKGWMKTLKEIVNDLKRESSRIASITSSRPPVPPIPLHHLSSPDTTNCVTRPNPNPIPPSNRSQSLINHTPISSTSKTTSIPVRMGLSARTSPRTKHRSNQAMVDRQMRNVDFIDSLRSVSSPSVTTLDAARPPQRPSLLTAFSLPCPPRMPRVTSPTPPLTPPTSVEASSSSSVPRVRHKLSIANLVVPVEEESTPPPLPIWSPRSNRSHTSSERLETPRTPFPLTPLRSPRQIPHALTYDDDDEDLYPQGGYHETTAEFHTADTSVSRDDHSAGDRRCSVTTKSSVDSNRSHRRPSSHQHHLSTSQTSVYSPKSHHLRSQLSSSKRDSNSSGRVHLLVLGPSLIPAPTIALPPIPPMMDDATGC